MSKQVLLTSTCAYARIFNCRLANKQIFSFDMPAYGLNVPVDFPSEEAFEKFKTNEGLKYFVGEFPVLLEGKKSAGIAEKINEKAEKKRAKEITEQAEAAVKPVTEATQDSGVSVSIEVETGAGNK